VFRDVTEEYRMQEALRESEERYRTVAEFTYDWEYWIGPDRRFIYCSPACERITSYRAEEFEKDPGLLIAITHPDDHDQVVCYMDDIVAPNSESHELEFRILTRSGEVRWIAHACRVVRGQDGTYRGRRASNRDITERKQMQEALQKAFDDIKTLRGILPICMHCKKIRDDKGYWKAVEVYVGAHTEAQFSHGICPECVKEYYPELEKDAAGSQELGTS
jgi:PAS domain S-box-containing protein